MHEQRAEKKSKKAVEVFLGEHNQNEISITIYLDTSGKKPRGNYMNKKILLLSDLIEVIEKGMISIVSVESKIKSCSDITETGNVTPEKFIESIQYLDKTIFKDMIDFFYEFTGKKDILIECEMKNMYVKEYYRVECAVKEGISIDDIDKKFRETIFDRMK